MRCRRGTRGHEARAATPAMCAARAPSLRVGSSPLHCKAFSSSLNNSHCDGMVRVAAAESSAAACRAWCCNASNECNAYSWHVAPAYKSSLRRVSTDTDTDVANARCEVSSSVVDPSACHHINTQPVTWIGESRFVPPAPPPAVSQKRGYSGFLGTNYTCERGLQGARASRLVVVQLCAPAEPNSPLNTQPVTWNGTALMEPAGIPSRGRDPPPLAV